jgi:hypothetical protein
MKLIDKILTEWSYRVHDGMPNPKNPLHIVQLKESLKYLKISEMIIEELVENLINEKKDELKVVKGQNPTTVYHEVLCALAMKGSLSKIKNGNDILKAIPRKVKPGVPEKKFDISKRDMGYLKDATHEKMDTLKTDAESIAKSIKNRIGKHTSGPVFWAGPSNDSTDYGASDMIIKTKKHGYVGVSLKAGKGQLKNLTINTFFKALGIPFGDGQDAKAAAHFLKNYKEHWDAMTKDWVGIVKKEFNRKTKDTKAREIFQSHIKTDWDSFQSEKMTQDEMDTLTDAVGMAKLDKSTNFKYFCHKLGNHLHGQKSYPDWNKKRTKHFENIFKDFGDEYETEIHTGLSDLFARQMSVGKKNMFYAASAGKTIWFIPSEKTFNEFFSPDDFIAQFRTEASGSGYDFFLDVGHIDEGAIGTIKVTFRFKQGQMTKFPDTTSDYDLYADDWSKLLGTFEK